VQVAGAAWRAATRIVAGVGDLVQRTEDGRTGWVLGGQMIGRSGDVVCGTVCQLFVLKTTRTIFSSLASKSVATVSLGWPQNQWWRVSRFGHQNRQLRFGDLGLKITVTVSWFGSQNQVGYGLSVV
jgi:hypothetical protein